MAGHDDRGDEALPATPHPPLLVPSRCCGPDTSGNGGWVCGAVAASLDARPAEVSLRLPPPLDVPMTVDVRDDEDGARHVTVTHDGAVVAIGGPGAFAAEPPTFVPLDVAVAAAERYIGFVDHAFPHCMSCGPARAVGDGLRVFPGALDPDDLTRMAAPWHAGDLPDAVDGVLPEPIVWTALDCPSGWPSIASAARPMVLGRMTTEVLAPVPAEDLVVVGVELWSEGRKHAGASALYRADGTLLARAETLWIELR